jgi:hypothetical protein
MEVRSVEAIARALNDAEIQYIVVGGLAVNAHGYERFTRDIDLGVTNIDGHPLMSSSTSRSISLRSGQKPSAFRFAKRLRSQSFVMKH